MNDLLATALAFIESLHPWVLGTVSVVMFAGSVVLIPWAVVQIPVDYFKSAAHRAPLWRHHPPLLRMAMIVVKNLVGLLLVITGVALLFLPGQGLITMVIGLLLLDMPGKFRFERWLLSHKVILQPVNWLRIKRNKPALQL